MQFSPADISDDAMHLLNQRLQDCRMHPRPPDFPIVSCPIFEFHSSDKLRLIHDARFINLFIDAPTFSLPRAEDPLKFVTLGDYFFVMDFSIFWSQTLVSYALRRYFCTTAKIDGVLKHFTWTGGSFGNAILPFLATKMLQKIFSNISYFLACVHYLDDS